MTTVERGLRLCKATGETLAETWRGVGEPEISRNARNVESFHGEFELMALAGAWQALGPLPIARRDRRTWARERPAAAEAVGSRLAEAWHVSFRIHINCHRVLRTYSVLCRVVLW